MGRILKPYPDVVEAVMLLVESWYPEEFAPRGDEYRTGRVFPPNLVDIIAAGGCYCRVTDIGGNDDGITDRPLIDVDVFANSFKQSRDLAVGIQARLLGAPWRIGKVVIDRARTAMRPHDVPWDADEVFRHYASYIVGARR